MSDKLLAQIHRYEDLGLIHLLNLNHKQLYQVRVIAYNVCWVSRGDVPWNVSTQPTLYHRSSEPDITRT